MRFVTTRRSRPWHRVTFLDGCSALASAELGPHARDTTRRPGAFCNSADGSRRTMPYDTVSAAATSRDACVQTHGHAARKTDWMELRRFQERPARRERSYPIRAFGRHPNRTRERKPTRELHDEPRELRPCPTRRSTSERARRRARSRSTESPGRAPRLIDRSVTSRRAVEPATRVVSCPRTCDRHRARRSASMRTCRAQRCDGIVHGSDDHSASANDTREPEASGSTGRSAGDPEPAPSRLRSPDCSEPPSSPSVPPDHSYQSAPNNSTGCSVRSEPLPQARCAAGQRFSQPQQIRSGWAGASNEGFTEGSPWAPPHARWVGDA